MGPDDELTAELRATRQVYDEANRRFLEVARRYFSGDPRNWPAWREEYQEAMRAVVQSSLALHAIEEKAHRARVDLRDLGIGISAASGRIAPSLSTDATSKTSASPP